MTAKEYLNKIHRDLKTAEALHGKISALRSEMEGLKAVTYDRDRVQTSPADRMSEMIPRLVDLEEKYAKAVADYYEGILVRVQQIAEIGRADYEEILRLRYIEVNKEGKRYTLEEIAVKTHRSFDRVAHLHGDALEAFRRKYLKDDKQ